MASSQAQTPTHNSPGAPTPAQPEPTPPPRGTSHANHSQNTLEWPSRQDDPHVIQEQKQFMEGMISIQQGNNDGTAMDQMDHGQMDHGQMDHGQMNNSSASSALQRSQAEGEALLAAAQADPPLRNVRIRSSQTDDLLLLKGAELLDRVAQLLEGLTCVSADRVVRQTLRGLYDGCPEDEVQKLLIRSAAALVPEEPEYSLAAARLLDQVIVAEVLDQGIKTFGDCIRVAHENGLIADHVADFVAEHAETLDSVLRPMRGRLFGYFGLQTIYDRYLLKHPHSRLVVEMPQYFFMRVACGLARNLDEAVEMYELISKLDYLPSSPTLFNSGTRHMQMSSCYLLDSPSDNLEAIYSRYTDIAQLSKFSGGIGVAYHRIRSRGSLIRGTNGHSNGIIPWLKTLDSSVAAVNQGGRRKGACAVYLETWHADIEEFLELRENTGEEARRTHNLNLANWIPDLFMARVEAGEMWSLFSPSVVPHLTDLWGERFETAFVEAEKKELYERQLPARELYGRMMRALAQTGQGWMTFKDACNRTANQTANPENVVHSSNLCTEILEVTNDGETAVCNLGSLNLSRFVTHDGEMDFERLRDRVAVAVKYLDRVVDINYYPTTAARDSNLRWRPVGLGIMGLQDVLFKMRLPFDSDRAKRISTRIQEEIYFQALSTSCDLAAKLGAHTSFAETRAARGELQFDSWGITPTDVRRWDQLRQRIVHGGLRNSLLIAIAPTATIASISGCYECIEPMVSNLFKRETLSGDFLQINTYLVADLKKIGLWTAEIREAIKTGNGSIQHIEEIPSELRHLYRTAWELSQKYLIDMAAGRGAFIDQSQSLNLFMETPTIGKVSSMYMYAWKKGLKTTYYLRSRPATRIRQINSTGQIQGGQIQGGQIQGGQIQGGQIQGGQIQGGQIQGGQIQGGQKPTYTAEEIRVCSLENPEYCEACQ